MQPTLEPTNQGHRILVLSLTILLTAGVIGGGVYYALNQQMKNRDKLIEELQKKADAKTETKAEEKKASTPVVKDEIVDRRTYTNNQFGFILIFPDKWKNYGVTETKWSGITKSIQFGVLRKEEDSVLDGFDKSYHSVFAIGIYTTSQWTELQKEEGPKPKEIQRKDGYVYSYSAGNGTAELLEFQADEPYGDIKTIIDTFKFN